MIFVSDTSHIPNISELIMKVSSIIQMKPQSKTRSSIPLKSDIYSVIKIPAKDLTKPAFEIIAICDPASNAAQKLGPIIYVLQQVLNANIKVVLNAVEKHSEMPLKR